MVLVSYGPIIFVSCLAIVMDFLQAGRKCEPLLCTEEPMTTVGRGARPHSNVNQQFTRT